MRTRKKIINSPPTTPYLDCEVDSFEAVSHQTDGSAKFCFESIEGRHAMALTNSLLYELSANSLEQNIELVELVLRSPVHIPQKREIVISWLCKCIEDHDSVPHSETAALWKLLHMLLEDMEPREVVIVAQDSFLKAMTNMLRGLENMDRQRHILLAASLLLQKAPQSILSLKLLSLEQMLAVALDRACLFVRNGQDCSDLCPTLSALMNVLITSWQQAPCTLEEAISHMKPLLSHMMLFLHLERKNASEGLSNVCSQIRRMMNVMFFHRDKMSVWLACLSTYLKGEETEEQDKPSCLQLLSAFFGQVCETQICANTEPPVETFLPEFFATFLEGFITHNKTEDIQSNVVLLAYFAHLLGVQCEEAFGKSVFQGLSFTPELQLYHVNRLLQVYEQSKQYHLMVALPQLKKSLFKPKKWFGELVPGLQAMEHTNVSWFTCLNTAMNIAPNLVEGSMIKTLQKCWTVPSLGDQDILRVVDEFLENVLHTYNKLFRIPKLVRNIFSSLSNLEAKVSKSTCISALFLKNFSECCTSLSSGQVTESWHLFVSQLSYWISQNKETKDSKDFYKILLVTEIFITFLHHIQAANPTMPAIHVTKVTELMATTSKLAAEMLDFSIENKSVDSSYCSLVMFHAWGELHMLLCSYRRVYGESVAWPTLPAPLEQTHLSYLHPALTPAKLEALQPLLDKGKNKRALYALLLLHIQKIRALLLFTEAANEHLAASLEAAAKFVFSNADLNVHHVIWSQRVSEVSKEAFPLASLHLLLIHCPMLAPHLSAKNLHFLCRSILELLANEKDIGDEEGITPRVVVTTYLQSQAFVECKPMQTAFVTALWSKTSEGIKAKKRKHNTEEAPSCCRSLFEALSGSLKVWEKYAESVPQPDYASKKLLGIDSLNKMWALIHHASVTLAEIMNSAECSEKINVEDVLLLTQGLQYLPLDCLFPGNQTRCLLGLFGILFMLDDMSEERKLDENRLEAVSSCCTTLVMLLQSTRRSWLLDFVDSGSLLGRLATSFSGNLFKVLEDDALHEMYQSIVNAIVREACKKKNTLRTLIRFVKQLSDGISAAEQLPSKAYATAAIALFSQLTTELSKGFLHEDIKGNMQRMAHSLSKALDLWLQQMVAREQLPAQTKKQVFVIGSLHIQYATSVHKLSAEGNEELYSEATSAALSMALSELLESKVEEMGDELLGFLAQAVKCREKLSGLLSVTLPDIWTGVHSQFTLQALHFLPDQKQSSDSEPTTLTFENILSEKQVSFLQVLFGCCTVGELLDILEKLFPIMHADNVASPTMKVHLKMFEILCSCLDIDPGELGKEISKILQKFIEYFAVIMAIVDAGNHAELAFYILRLLGVLLNMKKSSLSHLSGIVALQLLSSLDLPGVYNSPAMFCSCFTALCRILSTFLSRRIAVVVGCTAGFQACVSMLLQSIIRVSGIEELKQHPPDFAYQLQMCALSLERLVTSMGSHKREFQKVAPFLISDYILESVNLVLHPPIKRTLLFVVYKLFDLADQHTIAMVHATLPKEGTEVFKSLYADSQKVRFKGKV